MRARNLQKRMADDSFDLIVCPTTRPINGGCGSGKTASLEIVEAYLRPSGWSLSRVGDSQFAVVPAAPPQAELDSGTAQENAGNEAPHSSCGKSTEIVIGDLRPALPDGGPGHAFVPVKGRPRRPRVVRTYDVDGPGTLAALPEVGLDADTAGAINPTGSI